MRLSFSGGCQHQCLTTAHGIVNSLQCPNNEGCSLASASPHLSKTNFVSLKLVVVISHANRLSATSLTSFASILNYIKLILNYTCTRTHTHTHRAYTNIRTVSVYPSIRPSIHAFIYLLSKCIIIYGTHTYTYRKKPRPRHSLLSSLCCPCC